MSPPAYPSSDPTALGRPPDAEQRMPMDEMRQMAARQQRQDWVFHQLTRLFSWVVLLALVGIVISLIINATPAFSRFGVEFIWRVEWDIINQEFGAAIAIFGTVVSAGIALLIAVPLSFGIALFLTEFHFLLGRIKPRDAVLLDGLIIAAFLFLLWIV